MGIRHLITFLRPYSTLESLAGQQIVIDGPAFAHHIYYICLKGTKSAQNAIEAAPSYSSLVKTALQWLEGLKESKAVIKKIYFDGYLPIAKYDVRVERLIRYTQQLTSFHIAKPTPCRASYPRSENELDDPFNSFVPSSLAGLPSLSFAVPAILEALVESAEYGAITEVVPGEADTWCAEYLRQGGGLVLTGDSDLLVHDLGQNGAVSFLKDVKRAPGEGVEGSYILQTDIHRPANIAKRLGLPTADNLQPLAFEIVMDPYITFPKLVKQAQKSYAKAKHPKEYADFLKEYSPLPPPLPVFPNKSKEARQLLGRMDPRISEYVLHCLSFAEEEYSPARSTIEAHIFLPFLLDCPIHTSAWESSMPVRQLAYSFANMMALGDEQFRSVFEHRKQVDKSQGRELHLTKAASLPDSCELLLLQFSRLKAKLPELGECHIWTAWSIDQNKSLATQFLQQFQQLEDLPEIGNFTWDTVRFFAEVQATYYSFRMLKQIMEVVIAINGNQAMPSSVQSLYDQLQSLPNLTQFPSLIDASCSIRMIGNEEPIVAIKHMIHTLAPPIAESETPTKATKKKKRKRDAQQTESSDIKKRPINMFELLSAE